jgi:hypothetical protein
MASMFEDVERQLQEGFVITRDAPDRAIVFAIWSRNEVGQLPVADAWGVLAQRYPSEPRYLLLHAYAQLVGHGDSWTATVFLDDVKKILDAAGGRLHPEVRDLLATAEDDLHQLEEGDAARLERIRARVGSRTGDATAARKRLARLAMDFVRELHERTQGGKSLGGESGTTDWKSAVAAASATATKQAYAATAKVAAGDLVEHPKFGVGVVLAVEPGRANILFESGARKLLCG